MAREAKGQGWKLRRQMAGREKLQTLKRRRMVQAAVDVVASSSRS
jgi:hypothetical protein